MHSFIVVAARPGRTLPPHVLELLRQPDHRDLAFRPTDHVAWTDATGTIAFGGWQRTEDIVELGSHWHVGPHRLTAFTGRLWRRGGMWDGRRSWAEQLDEHWQADRSDDLRGSLDGIYTALSLSDRGAGQLMTDPLSIAMLYRSETDDFIAFSSACQLAARAAAHPGTEPARDALTAAWLPYMNQVVGDRTGFIDVRVLPPGTTVALSPAFGSRVHDTEITPWAPRGGLPDSEEELVELAREDLLASMRSICRLPAKHRRADITGGRDSRLVLAAMVGAGVADAFDFRTTGAEHAPDSVAGSAVAERFGLDHRLMIPKPMPETDFRRRLATHVFQTSGMLSAQTFKGSLAISGDLKVSGVLGEVLRTNYKQQTHHQTLRELHDDLDRYQRLNPIGIVRPDVSAELRRTLVGELVDRVDAAGSTPQDHLDTFYVRNRLRRWFGTQEELGEAGRVFPLYSIAAMQAAFAVGSEKRWNEWLPFEIIRSISPELAKMPLADAPWPDVVFEHLPDADEYRQPPVTYDGPKAVRWQGGRLEQNWNVVEEILLDDQNNPVFDVIDRSAVVELMDRSGPAGKRRPEALYGALTAAMWLGGHEERHKVGDGWTDDLPAVAPPRVARWHRPVSVAPAVSAEAGRSPASTGQEVPERVPAGPRDDEVLQGVRGAASARGQLPSGRRVGARLLREARRAARR